MIRVHALNFSVSSMLTGGDMFAGLNSANTVYGAAIGIDLGAIAEMGWLPLDCRFVTWGAPSSSMT